MKDERGARSSMTTTHKELKKNRAYGPSVRLIRRDSHPVVEKTYREKTFPVRLIGRVTIFWERFIYSKLTSLEGIPEVMPGSDSLTLVTRFMGGTNLNRLAKAPGKGYFDSLKALISAMHKRGVIHLDLRNRRNYGIDDDGRPYLVDFASCLYLPWDGRLKRILETIDWMGFAKIKQRLAPLLMDERDKNLLVLGNRLSSMWIPGKVFRALRKTTRRIGR